MVSLPRLDLLPQSGHIINVSSVAAVTTELPNSITEPDMAERMRKVYSIAIPADFFANMVVFATSQPEDVDGNEILFRPARQEY